MLKKLVASNFAATTFPGFQLSLLSFGIEVLRGNLALVMVSGGDEDEDGDRGSGRIGNYCLV